METSQLEALAAQVLQAEDTRTPIGLPASAAELSLDEGYRVMLAYVATRLARGDVVIGKKVGATSKAVQQLTNTREPVFGFNFALDAARGYTHPYFAEGEPVSAAQVIHPKIETELAFVLRRRLEGPGVTVAAVLRATEGVMPAFEIADCRFTTWRMPVPAILVDNCHACGIALGAQMAPVRMVDLRHTGVVLEKNGEVAGTAALAAALGNPALAVAWLANALARYEFGLAEGDIVLTGALTPVYDARAGDYFHATFAGLGSVSARFV